MRLGIEIARCATRIEITETIGIFQQKVRFQQPLNQEKSLIMESVIFRVIRIYIKSIEEFFENISCTESLKMFFFVTLILF